VRQNKVGEVKLFRLFGHFSLLLFLGFSTLNAQSFENFKKSQAKSFQTYKDERDIAFRKYLTQNWKSYKLVKPTTLYEKPKPKEITPAQAKKIKAIGPKITVQVKKTIKSEAKPNKKDIEKPIEKIIIIKKPKVAVKHKDIYFDF